MCALRMDVPNARNAKLMRHPRINPFRRGAGGPTPPPPLGTRFAMEVETTAPDETFTIPAANGSTYNCTVDWGDGSTSEITSFDDPDLTHTYAMPGLHEIRIEGTFPVIYFNGTAADRAKLRRVIQLGEVGWTSFLNAFEGCTGMTEFVSGECDTSSVQFFNNMFEGCTALTAPDLSTMDVSGATSLQSMFFNSGVTDLSSLADWDVSGVRFFTSMFRDCDALTDIDLSNWSPSAAQSLSSMFQSSSQLTNVTFGNWNMPNLTTISQIFRDCFDLGTVNVNGWVMPSLSNISDAFRQCGNLFDLDVSDWDVAGVTNASRFMLGTSGAMEPDVYDTMLTNWGAQTLNSGVTLDMGATNYTAAGEAGRNAILAQGWTINDAGLEA